MTTQSGAARISPVWERNPVIDAAGARDSRADKSTRVDAEVVAGEATDDQDL
ncbi:hypothetical protein JOD67_006909 [Tenggerimyces flavus]|nr:hypothetical protein [Tenggerimyces flavus]